MSMSTDAPTTTNDRDKFTPVTETYPENGIVSIQTALNTIASTNAEVVDCFMV